MASKHKLLDPNFKIGKLHADCSPEWLQRVIMEKNKQIKWLSRAYSKLKKELEIVKT